MLTPGVGAVSSQHPSDGPVVSRTGIATNCLASACYIDEEIWSFTLESKVTYFSSCEFHGGGRATRGMPIL